MKKLLSVLLTVAMLACMLPVFAVSAANPEVPVAKIDGKVMTGATASGNKTWNITADGLTNTDGGSIFVFDQEFKEGTIEWTMTTKGGDNGIVFGLEGESMDFWEAGDRYYFLFANNNTGEMILAKTGEGLGWCWMKAMPIPNFQKNATVDMKLVYDGDGHMEIYGNGALVYDYCDAKPLTGTRVGVRAGGANVTYSNINITTSNEGPDGGIKGGVALPFAKNGDKTLTGYFSGGPWCNDGSKITVTDTALVHDTWATTFIIDNDNLPLTDGSLTGTVTPGNGNAVDNFLTGIIFGMEANKNVTVWKNANYSPEYYVLFISQGRIDDDHVEEKASTKLVLAKGGTVVHDDKLTVLAETVIADGHVYNGTKDVTLKAEFKMVDGKLEIKGFADGEQKLTYTDEDPLTGTRYGFSARCGGSKLTALVPVDNVCYHANTEVVGAKEATETEKGYTGDTVCKDCGETLRTGEETPVKTPATPAPTGDAATVAAALAVLAVIGTGIIVTKKREF